MIESDGVAVAWVRAADLDVRSVDEGDAIAAVWQRLSSRSVGADLTEADAAVGKDNTTSLLIRKASSSLDRTPRAAGAGRRPEMALIFCMI